MNSEETSNITQNWTTPSLTTILFQHQLSTGQNMFRKAINIGVAILICCGVGFRLCTIHRVAWRWTVVITLKSCLREQLQLMARFLLTTSLVCKATDSLVLDAKSFHCSFGGHSTDNQTIKKIFWIFFILYYFKTIHENELSDTYCYRSSKSFGRLLL